VLKDKNGNITSTDMYRLITLTPVISKLFESVLLQLFVAITVWFKKRDWLYSHALFTVTESVKHFCE